MKFVVLRHQDEEGLGTVSQWLKRNHHSYFYVNLYGGQRLPSRALVAYDGLIAMGGPQSVNDTSDLMCESLNAVDAFLSANRPTLGICLGAQAMAKVSGGAVSASTFEFGFSTVRPVLSHRYFSHFANQSDWDVFQWHGENFSLPLMAEPLFFGDAVVNQAFTLKRGLGLQFHCELDAVWYSMWYDSVRHKFPELTPVMQPLSSAMPFDRLKQNLFQLLDQWQREW